MKNIFKILAIITIGLSIGLDKPIFVFGQESGSAAYYGNSSSAINKELEELNQEIENNKNKIKKLEQKQSEYSDAIKQKQLEQASLNNQVAILENKIAKAELDIERTEAQIDRTNLEIQKTNLEIENKNNQIESEKKDIGNILSLMNKSDNVTSLEIMLLNDSFADFLSQIKYLEEINKTVKDSVDELKNFRQQLEEEKVVLSNKNNDLEKYKRDILIQQRMLDSEKENKTYVLIQTKESEKQYQKLLQEAKREQDQASADIVSIEKTVRKKLAELEGEKIEINSEGFAWPVAKNTITAYFHDPDYPFRYIFEHPGVDIRAGYGSAIKAVASGYVARVKYDGTSKYAYIMLIHADSLSTVYGHVSKVYVKEEDYVVQGQKIGLSGGLPGTPGAGGLTTGPHFHFEVRLNGIPVDPLGYLP